VANDGVSLRRLSSLHGIYSSVVTHAVVYSDEQLTILGSSGATNQPEALVRTKAGGPLPGLTQY